MQNAALEAIASAAPALKEAELRVLLELTRRALEAGSITIRASSRELANACKVSRSNVKPAIDSLTAKALLTTRQGTATAAAAYQLNILETVRIQTVAASKGGPVTGPPPAIGWARKDPTLGPEQAHGGPTSGPPPAEGIDLFPRAHDIEFDKTPNSIIDRTLQARPGNFPKGDLEELRAYAGKWLRAQRGMWAAHPPDETTAAQLATAAGGTGAAIGLVQNLLMGPGVDRQAETCQYLVTLALQRIHGVQPNLLRARRGQLKLMKRGRPVEPLPPNPDTNAPDPLFPKEILAKAVAASKNLR